MILVSETAKKCIELNTTKNSDVVAGLRKKIRWSGKLTKNIDINKSTITLVN